MKGTLKKAKELNIFWRKMIVFGVLFVLAIPMLVIVINNLAGRMSNMDSQPIINDLNLSSFEDSGINEILSELSQLTSATTSTFEISTSTDDWQVYRNEELGFLFSFPASWSIENDTLPQKGEEGVFDQNLYLSNNDVGLIIWVNYSGFDFIGDGMPARNITYELVSSSDNKMELTNRDEFIYTESSEFGTIDSEESVISVFSENLMGNSYGFRFYFKTSGPDYEPFFQQIISTFQFIE